MLKIKIDFDTLVALSKLDRYLLGNSDAEVEVVDATRLDHPYIIYREDSTGMLIDVGYDFMDDTVYVSSEEFCERNDWAELDEHGDIVEKTFEE